MARIPRWARRQIGPIDHTAQMVNDLADYVEGLMEGVVPGVPFFVSTAELEREVVERWDDTIDKRILYDRLAGHYISQGWDAELLSRSLKVTQGPVFMIRFIKRQSRLQGPLTERGVDDKISLGG